MRENFELVVEVENFSQLRKERKLDEVKMFIKIVSIDRQVFISKRRRVIVLIIRWVSEFLLDDDRGRALWLLKRNAAIASDAVAGEVVNEQMILEANFHGAEGCRDVSRFGAALG